METLDTTHTLQQARRGESAALDLLFPLVYEELRRLARRLMQQERGAHTLQTTALVHEAYLRLCGQHSLDPADRRYFLGVAATLMRRILVNHARDRAAQKRGDGIDRLSLTAAAHVSDDRFDLIGLHESLDELAKLNARQARVVELKFFAGLELTEIAVVLEISAATVKRDWTMARLWRSRELSP